MRPHLRSVLLSHPLPAYLGLTVVEQKHVLRVWIFNLTDNSKALRKNMLNFAFKNLAISLPIYEQ